MTFDWQAFFKALLAFLLALFPLLGLGCEAGGVKPPQFYPSDMAKTATGGATDVILQSIWDNMQFTSSGEGVEPGIAIETAIVWRSAAYIKGAAGQFSISAQGHGTGERPTDSPDVEPAD